MHALISVSGKHIPLSCKRASAHGWSTVQVRQRGGWALFRMLPHLTMKEHLAMSYVYSDSMPSKQIIGQTIVYNGATSGFEVKAWQHTTLCHRELRVCTALVMSVYAKVPCNSFQWTFLAMYASQTPQVHCITQAKLTPGWMLIRVNFDPIQEIGLKK